MFICTLDNDTNITSLHGNGEFIYKAAIGYDLETQHVFSVFVIFAPLAGYGDGTGYDLVFRLVEASLDGSYVQDYHDGLVTKRFISEPSDRASIFDVVKHLVERHIDEQRPPKVEMTTHTANLPPEALRKFHEIAAVFRHNGYSAGTSDPWHGKWIWMMRLKRTTPRRSLP